MTDREGEGAPPLAEVDSPPAAREGLVYDEELAAFHVTDTGIDLSGLDRMDAFAHHLFASIRFRALYAGAIFSAGALLLVAQRADLGGLLQQVCIGLSVGITIFLFTAFMVAASRHIGRRAHLIVVGLLGCTALAAAMTTDLLRSLFVTVATALAVCLLMDLSFRRVEAALALELEDAARRRRELKERLAAEKHQGV